MQGLGVLAERQVVLMTTSPFGLPLRVDLPNVDPADWEDEEEDD
jgi:hypothetical protein